MPRPNDYPRWRYITMQCVMWLLFAATLGLAALTDSARQAGFAAQLKLRNPIELESISIQVPDKWRIVENSSDELRVMEPTRSRDSRWRSLQISESDASFDWTIALSGRARTRKDTPISMGPITGKLTTSFLRVAPVGADQAIECTQLRARGVLPSGKMVSVTLLAPIEGDDEEVDPDDLALIKRIANSIKLIDVEADRPQMRPGPTSHH